jgi:hypothetical protein
VKHVALVETTCKEWTRGTKQKEPRQLMPALNIEPLGGHRPRRQGPVYERNPTCMAELAREYHHSVQEVDMNLQTKEERDTAIKAAAVRVIAQPTEKQKATLGDLTTKEDLLEVLRYSKNESAAGLDSAT